MGSAKQHYDVVVVGGGHNGLTAAAYLARSGAAVLLLERLSQVGGAAVSAEIFAGQPVRLPRYASLVSPLPERIVADLGLDVRLVSPATASYTPLVRDGRHTGLLVERPESAATRASFRILTGDTEEYLAWRALEVDAAGLARAVAPTLLQPLPQERQIRAQVEPRVWDDLVGRPLGQTLVDRFADDTVRGLVASGALRGTLTWLDDPSLRANRTFLHHTLGNGSGEWQVPVGGVGAVSEALARAAAGFGAELLTSAGVSAIRAHDDGAEVGWQDATGSHTVSTQFVLANVAPWVLQILLGSPDDPTTKPEGAQFTFSALVERLPRLRSGLDPEMGFAGTLRIAQGYDQLAAAATDAAAGRLPEVIPGEIVCPSLSDPSVLGDLAGSGAHVLTYVGLCTPASVFQQSPEATKAEAVRRALASLDEHLEEPLAECLARDADGNACLDVRIPQDLEAHLAMPGGHPFHGDLDWPWASNRARLDTPAQQWGVQTDVASVVLCGAGARRGGGVSGIAGHNAAHALLATR